MNKTTCALKGTVSIYGGLSMCTSSWLKLNGFDAKTFIYSISMLEQGGSFKHMSFEFHVEKSQE
jgi:hypothetical protein